MKRNSNKHKFIVFCTHPKGRYLASVLCAILSCCSFQTLHGADAKATAETLLSFEGLRPGLCVHIGGTDAGLLAELAAAGDYHVHGLTSDSSSVDKMRQHVASKDLYGQVVVDHSLLTNLPYANNLINVLVVEDFAGLQKNGLTVKEIMRAVAPENSALLGNSPGDLMELIAQAGYKDAIIHQKGQWTQIIKPRPEEMDDWSEHYHDSGSSATSGDLLVQKPNSTQWIAGDLAQHEAGPSSMIMMNGRIFSLFNGKIFARDAFNGLKLWEQSGGPGKNGAFDCWIATKDHLFTVLQRGGPLVALDTSTGKTMKTYDFSPAKISYYDDILLAIDNDGTVRAQEVTGDQALWSKKIQGLSGSSHDSFNMKSFSPLSTARRIVSEGKVFLTLDKTQEFLCLDLKTGKELWRIASQGGSLVSYKHGILLSAGRVKGKEVFNAAHSAEDGTLLWRFDYSSAGHGGHPFNVFYVDGLVWVHTAAPAKKEPEVWHGLNPKTGEVQRSIDWKQVKHRCFSDKATERYIMSGSMDFLEVKDGQHHKFTGGRGNCSSGFTPANGLLYQHPNVCVCASQVRGFVAFGADASFAGQEVKLPAIAPRQTGPGKATDEIPSSEDWPMFRHNPTRSGSTTAKLPMELTPIWEMEIGGRLSSPVVACGKVFVTSIDSHRLIVLDEKNGKKVWEYRANGRIDSPPTIYAGMAIFGCSDGWVYSVSSATGELIWSLQAAPQQRWLVSQGQVESAWPIHGSILIDNDTAYFAAGRQTEVDGGIVLYAVSPQTGQMLWHKQLFCATPGQYGGGSNANHILVSDSQTIAMDHIILDAKTGSPHGGWRTSTQGKADFFWGGPTGFLTDIALPAAGWHELNHRQWAVSSAGTYRDHTRGLILVFSMDKVYGVRIAQGKTKADKTVRFELFCNSKREGKKQAFWQTTMIDVLTPKALIHADSRLYIAAVNESDESSKGTLLIYDAKEGRALSTVPLNVRPRFDGMAAANGRLIIVGQDGEMTCLGQSDQE